MSSRIRCRARRRVATERTTRATRPPPTRTSFQTCMRSSTRNLTTTTVQTTGLRSRCSPRRRTRRQRAWLMMAARRWYTRSLCTILPRSKRALLYKKLQNSPTRSRSTQLIRKLRAVANWLRTNWRRAVRRSKARGGRLTSTSMASSSARQKTRMKTCRKL